MKLSYNTGAAMIFWSLKEMVKSTMTPTQSVIHSNKDDKTNRVGYLKKMNLCPFTKLALERIEHHVMIAAQTQSQQGSDANRMLIYLV